MARAKPTFTKISVSMSDEKRIEIDRAAEIEGLNRSAFITVAALRWAREVLLAEERRQDRTRERGQKGFNSEGGAFRTPDQKKESA